jgi:penicillin-binding protein 2
MLCTERLIFLPVGIVIQREIRKDFGLGVKTGVEVDDSKGIILEPKSDGLGGDTLQISIGQMNAFTPLQLANYGATLANGGTHYKATLIDKVVEYNNVEKVLEEMEPQVLNTVWVNPEQSTPIQVLPPQR